MRQNVHRYTRTSEAPPSASLSETPFYSDDVLPELQSTLATLADIEVQFEIVQDSLEEWCGSEEEKQRCRAELEQTHQQLRETHLKRLTELREQMGAHCLTH